MMGAISSQVASLAEEVLRTTTLATSKKLLITSALLILIAMMSGVLTYEIVGYLQHGALWGCETPAKTEPRK